MKKLLFLFLFSIIFLSPIFVNAEAPYSISAGGVELTNSNGSYQISGDSSYKFKVEVVDYGLHNFYILYVSVANTDNLSAFLSGGCNVSCFGSNVNVYRTGISGDGYPNFAVVLRKGKADCGVGSGACIMDNFLTLSSNKPFYLNVNGAFATDTDPSLYSNFQDFQNVINSQNQNSQNIINNQNQNSQNIINNQNQNSQNIINNQNQNSQNIINNQNQNSQNIIDNQNQNQHQTNEKLDDVNNSLNSEEAPTDNDISNKTQEWSSKLAGTGPVSNMVLMPITLLNGYINGFNSVCTSYNLGNFYGTDIVLPCINISNYVGSNLWSIIDILFSGFMIFAIGKKFVKIFNDFTNLRDNQMDDLYGGGK